jgi:hypothetical protein
MDTLYAHVHKWMASQFVWGESDCMLVLADYLVDLGYADIGDIWRGTYDSALSCQRVSGFLTDPVKPLREGAERIGLPATCDPRRGDIGVITVCHKDGKVKAVGAVCLGQNWAIRSEHSVLVDKALQVLAAWRVDRA